MTSLNYALPVTGQPNTTEDPKIVTALTAIESVVNGQLDTNNLSASAGIVGTQLSSSAAIAVTQLAATARGFVGTLQAGANYTAADRDFVTINGGSGTTVSLGSVSFAVQPIVGIQNLNANTATVTSGSGAVIWGAGLAATSFKLGVGGSVIIAGYGGAWFIISGQQDSGWVGLSFGTNVNQAPSDSYACAARLQGDTVTLRGQMSTAATINAGSTWATIPAGLRPAHNISAGDYSGGSGGWAVSAAGALTMGFGVGALNTVGIDGVTYQLS